jgi:hypothetical protein
MLAGSEVRVNSTTVGQQFHACVGSDGAGRFLSVWSGFVGGMASFDLVGQRWVNVAQPLLAMAAPFVHVPFVVTDQVYQPQLQVSWPLMSGLQVDHYEVYVNGLPTPRASLTTNLWLMTSAEGLTVNSTNYFQVAYVAADGRRSPLSAAAGARTWSGFNWGGIPGEWMQRYYGSINMMLWPNPSTLLAEGGPSLLQVFQSGASPLDPGTWLRTSIVREQDGYYLHWNPQPGLIYQVQTSLTLSNWANLGAPRFSAGTDDAINIGGNNAAYYRVLRLR